MEYTDKQIEQLIEGIFSGAITEYELPKSLYFAISDYLEKALKKGAMEAGVEFGGKPLELIAELRENIYMFSGAKTYQQVKEMTSLLVNDEGIRGFNDFKREALKVYEQYNVNWLNTEYNTAIGQAQSALRWQQIEEQADVLPMLKYSAIIDANTSDICRPLDGITLPVGDPFWNVHSPLNHFNCRCVLIQTDGKPTPKVLVDEARKEMDGLMQPVFKMNPGKDKVIFNEKHPYFDVAPKDKAYARRNFDLPIPEPKKANKGGFEPAKTTKEAQEWAKENSKGDVNYIDGVFRFKGTSKSAGLFDYSKMSLGRANITNEFLAEANKICDSLKIPRIRGVSPIKSKFVAANMGDGVMGYNPFHTNRVIKRAASEYKLGSGPVGQPIVASMYFSDGDDVWRSTLWHEFAHHLHQNYKVINKQDLLSPYAENILTTISKRSIKAQATAYAETNQFEWFAENYSLKKMGRADLVDTKFNEIYKKIFE